MVIWCFSAILYIPLRNLTSMGGWPQRTRGSHRSHSARAHAPVPGLWRYTVVDGGGGPPWIPPHWNSHESQVQWYNNSINRNCHYFWALKWNQAFPKFLGPQIAISGPTNCGYAREILYAISTSVLKGGHEQTKIRMKIMDNFYYFHKGTTIQWKFLSP